MNPFKPLIEPMLTAFPGLEAGDISFTTPPKLDLGDVAIPMFIPGRKLSKAPQVLAAEAAQQTIFGKQVRSAAAAGPYLNLKLDRAFFAKTIVEAILQEGDAFGSNHTGLGKRALIEHTSINPNASPHVGRARCAMIGDSISRLFRFEDYHVEVHYYVNDMGRQIGLLVLIADELEGMTFDQVLDAYVRANARAEQDPEFAAQGYELLAKMEEGDPDAQKKFGAVVDLCLQGQLAVLARIGAHYDVFDHESKYVKDPRLDHVLEALREKEAVFVDEEQRLVVDLAKLGHAQEEGRYFVLMRANGSSMYGYRDLAYTMDKEAIHADINLIALGEDHKLYFQQLAMILEAAGHKVPEPIYYSYILLKDGKMSTRQGNVVLLTDFLDEAIRRAAERVAEQCNDLTPEEQRVIAERVAIAAVRFAVLRVGSNKNVSFDMDAALSFEGDTGPYIQYSCARINSILRKYGQPLPMAPRQNFPIETDAEWALLTKLAAFPDVVSGALRQRTCAPIAVYVLEVSRSFTSFYHDCPVLTAGRPELVESRLLTCQAALQTLKNALYLLGIEVPERM
ncbi:MAG TPA: arginine--tRNA ligase [Candidatus Hydrogenedentes bacterium]|nr:arginine--tRNA ligase [Candidatus Hydrogenedentota bacterium]